MKCEWYLWCIFYIYKIICLIHFCKNGMPYVNLSQLQIYFKLLWHDWFDTLKTTYKSIWIKNSHVSFKLCNTSKMLISSLRHTSIHNPILFFCFTKVDCSCSRTLEMAIDYITSYTCNHIRLIAHSTNG